MRGIISKATHTYYYSKIESGAFVAILHPTEPSYAVQLTNKDLNRSDLPNEFFELMKIAKEKEGYKIKYVSNCDDKLLKEFFSTASVIIDKVILTEEQFEVLFNPEKGSFKYARGKKTETKSSTQAKILIIDDSKTIRLLLKKIFSTDPDTIVVGECENPKQAEKLIQELNPNVITLDIHMPEIDGVTLLKQILPKYKIPTIMITSISMEEGTAVIQALEEGAVDYIKKPTSTDISVLSPIILEKVKQAVTAKVQLPKQSQSSISKKSKESYYNEHIDVNKVIAIGSSTGGIDALKNILIRLPKNIPPILITQHIPAVFSKTFAERLNDLCPFTIKEAVDGEEIKPGHVYVAPGGFQMKINSMNGRLVIKVTDDAPVNRHKPSVDYLFESMASSVGSNGIGVLLTGMGSDGAKGLLKMRTAGAWTIAQSEKTCVVYGMPKEAVKLNAVQQVLDLSEIAKELTARFSHKKSA